MDGVVTPSLLVLIYPRGPNSGLYISYHLQKPWVNAGNIVAEKEMQGSGSPVSLKRKSRAITGTATLVTSSSISMSSPSPPLLPTPASVFATSTTGSRSSPLLAGRVKKNLGMCGCRTGAGRNAYFVCCLYMPLERWRPQVLGA